MCAQAEALAQITIRASRRPLRRVERLANWEILGIVCLSGHDGGAHIHGLGHEPERGDPEHEADCCPWSEGAKGMIFCVLLGESPDDHERAGEAQEQEPK